MKRAGEVVRTAQGVAIVRSPDADCPPIGTSLVDENLDDAGDVVDVFGPVDRPYLAVDPREAVRLPTLIGTPLYVR